MPWGARKVNPGRGVERDESLREYYRTLIALRRSNASLASGGYKLLSSDGDLLVFERALDSGNAVVVAVNRGTAPASAAVPAPPAWAGARVHDGLAGEAATMQDGKLMVSVAPRRARVYVRQD